MGYHDWYYGNTVTNFPITTTTAATTNAANYQQAFGTGLNYYPAPFTPTPVAAAPPPEHDDMTWLREQVAEIREAAFA